MNLYYRDKNCLESLCTYETALSYLNNSVARDIAINITNDLFRGSNANENRFGNTQNHLEWILEAMSFTLSLPLLDFEHIKICADIYIMWINNYATNVQDHPVIIYEHWDHFFPLLLLQLKNLFIPRQGNNINQHASLCARVLFAIKFLVIEKTLTPKNYDDILLFLLIISAKIFSQRPEINNNIFSEIFGETLASHFFYIWISVSFKKFPSITLWLSFDEVCSFCLHNEHFVMQWASVSLLLTKKTISTFKLSDKNIIDMYCNSKILNECFNPFDEKVLSSVWLKILFCIGNISSLAEPVVLSTKLWPTIVTFEMLEHHVADLNSVPEKASDSFKAVNNYLSASLPNSFLIATKLIFSIIQLFLPHIGGIDFNLKKWRVKSSTSSESSSSQKSIKLKDKKQVEFVRPTSVLGLETEIESSDFSYDYEKLNCFKNNKIRWNNFHPYENLDMVQSNTIINMLFDWLIESCVSFKDPKVSENIDYIIRQNYNLLNPTVQDPKFNLLLNDPYEIGRALAFHILIKLICLRPDNKEISPAFISRIYPLLCIGLFYHQHLAPFIFSSIITTSTEIFSCGLPNVEVLVPHYLRAIKSVLVDDLVHEVSINSISLKNSALQILNKIIPLALSVADFQSKDLSMFSEVSNSFETIAMFIVEILNKGFEKETDTVNIKLYINAFLTFLFELIYHMPVDKGSNIPLNIRSASITESAPLIKRSHTELKGMKPIKSLKSGDVDDIDIPRILKKFFGLIFHQVIARLREKAELKTFDLAISLCLVDVLFMFSLIPAHLINTEDAGNLIIELCKYITALANRPPLYQLRDVHSTVVYAYYCLTVWINRHNWILSIKNSLESIFSIIELGLTGSKSFDQNENKKHPKQTKQIKPISFRVLDAAEFLMHNLFEKISQTNISFFAYKNVTNDCLDNKKLMHFIIENIAIISCFDIDEDKEIPKTIVFIRTFMGKHAYQLELKTKPQTLVTESIETEKLYRNYKIDSHERILLKKPKSFDKSGIYKTCDADESFPSLDGVLKKCGLDAKKLLENFEETTSQLNTSYDLYKKSLTTDPLHACRSVFPEKFTDKYHAHRMLLNNLLLIHYDVPQLKIAKTNPRFIKIKENFLIEQELTKLDELTITSCTYAYMFTINAFHTDFSDILTSQKCLDPEKFNKFITQIGHQVLVKNHRGYLGPLKSTIHDNVAFIYDSDPLHELVIIPSYSILNLDTFENLMTLPQRESMTSVDSPITNHQETDSNKTKIPFNVKENAIKTKDLVIVIAWVEDPTNTVVYPLKKLINCMNFALDVTQNQPHTLIEVYPLEFDMVRVRTHNILSFSNIDQNDNSVVIQMKYVGHYVRNLIYSINMKKRLEFDCHNSPHLKRKAFIQNISKENFSESLNSKYYSNLIEFDNPSTVELTL